MVFFRSCENEIRVLIPVLDISEHTSIAIGFCSEQGNSVSGKQREANDGVSKCWGSREKSFEIYEMG